VILYFGTRIILGRPFIYPLSADLEFELLCISSHSIAVAKITARGRIQTLDFA